MTRACALVLVLAMTHVARAEDAPEGSTEPDGPPVQLPIKLREAYERGDFEEARRLLLQAYDLDPKPQLLFALGQVELNLKHYDAAIRYYEKFLATEPSQEQAALAQQAIGAARIKLAQPEPVEPPPQPTQVIPPRRWTLQDTGLTVVGGLAFGVGAGLVIASHRMGTDHSGTLSEFDERLARATTWKWTGIGIASAGALLVGVTVLRWRLRPDGGVMTAALTPSGITVAGRW